jgi:hypothetical protein
VRPPPPISLHPGALLETNQYNGFVMRFDPNGQRLWSTYSAFVHDVAIAPDGDIHVVGSIQGNFPFPLPGAYQPMNAGLLDAYHLELAEDGALVRGTYYGGSDGFDAARAVSAHAAGVDIGLLVNSTGLGTPGTHQPDGGGSSYDGLLVRLDPQGQRQWATYLGGMDHEQGMGIASTPVGVVVALSTMSSGLASPGAFQPVHGGGYDGLVISYDGSGKRQWATYLGTPGHDHLYGVALDPAGNILTIGMADGPGLATPDAFWQTPVSDDILVAKFDALGNRRWVTYYGGHGPDGINPTLENSLIASDGLDTFYITGIANSTDLATPDAFQTMSSYNQDGIVARFTQNLGLPCADAFGCETALCVDGVCCDAACGESDPNDCQACSAAAGAPADGHCAVLSADVVCRPPAHDCDAPELCPGDASGCPSDQLAADATPCRGGACEAGVCTSDSTATSASDPDPPTTGSDLPTSTSDPQPTGTDPTSTAGPGGATDGSSESSGNDTTGLTDAGCGCTSTPVPRDISLLALTLFARRRRAPRHPRHPR